MGFEWDAAKAKANLAKHGVSFREAATVFADPLFVEFYDPAHSLDEHRYVIVGQSDRGRLLVVSFSEWESAIRGISAREATRKERHDYEEE